jgi:glycosyltransferase involved in cell wall biosynthesis
VNHTGDFSGAEAALMRLLDGLPASVERAVACPADGPLAAALDAAGVERLDLPGTDLSFRLHPARTPAGAAALVASARVLARHQRRWRADVIHANGLRAGLMAVAPVARRRPPVVLQVHDRLGGGPAGEAVRRVLARGCADVLAVSKMTADAFNSGLRAPPAHVVPISVDHRRFRLGGSDPAATRRELGVAEWTPLLGEVAQITPWKGQRVAIEAFARLRRTWPDAQLLLVGHVAFSGPGVRYDNHAYRAELEALVRELEVEDGVRFLGQRDDIPAIMAALDLLLLPSWQEPFGTVAVEAMAVGTVPLVGDDGGVAEYLQDGVNGRALPPRRPELWAAAAEDLLADREHLRAMGRRAVETAAKFTQEAYARGCMTAYERVAA